ncbi:MAG: hypothetical protein AAF702_37735 [Chloroflexota bacterium]
MSKKQGSPLDSLQRRDLPKLDDIKSVRENNCTVEQLDSKNEVAKEPTRSSNVTLPISMWDWIDDRHREIQRSGWHSIRKAAVIRAIIQTAISVEVDLTGVTTEEEISQRYRSAIQQ